MYIYQQQHKDVVYTQKGRNMATFEKKRTLLTEIPTIGVYKDETSFQTLEGSRQQVSKSLLTDAINDAKDVRARALANAHDALVSAFGPKIEKVLTEKLTEAPSTQYEKECIEAADIDSLIEELEKENTDDDMLKECKKRLDEAKTSSVSTDEKEKMYRDIHRKFWAYVQSLPHRKIPSAPPISDSDSAVKKFMENKSGNLKWISHEGSMIICSLIAVSDDGVSYINLSQLPEADRSIVRESSGNWIKQGFLAKLDEYKNFSCESSASEDRDVKFTLGNRVSSIPPSESNRFGNVDVKVERKGKDILIGDRIKLEKERIQNLVSPVDSTNHGANRGGFQPRAKVAGRNAYEIRADILEMAIDWAKHAGKAGQDEDDVLTIADAFYSFVEHK